MTECQELMLSACFGGMVGLIIGEVGFIVTEFVLYIREKRRKRKKEKAAQQQSK